MARVVFFFKKFKLRASSDHFRRKTKVVELFESYRTV